MSQAVSQSSQPSIVSESFLTSFDLLSHTGAFLSLSDLLTLSTVSQSLHRVADSDALWRPRLLAATNTRHSPPTTHSSHSTPADCSEEKTADPLTADTDDKPTMHCTCDEQRWASPSASCKLQYLSRFQCAYSRTTGCSRLITPSPALLVQPRLEYNRTPGRLHCVQTVCTQCMVGLAVAVKQYYDERGEWAGLFTMTPLSIVPVPLSIARAALPSLSEAAVVVDVHYRFVGNYEDVDYRRFTVEWVDSSHRPQQTGRSACRIINTSRDAISNTTTAVSSASLPAIESRDKVEKHGQSSMAWQAVSMGGYLSGNWAFNSTTKVNLTDALPVRHTRLTTFRWSGRYDC